MEETQRFCGNIMACKAKQCIFVNCCYDASDFIFFAASSHSDISSEYKQSDGGGGGERWSACLLLLNATGFLDGPWVFEGGLDKLAKKALHVALTARKQTLQEGDVSTMGRQQQSDIRQALDYGHREGCAGRRSQI